MKVVTAEEMRRMDQLTIERKMVAGKVLMQRAGEGVAGVIHRLFLKPSCMWILAGSGNNGGDGAVVATKLFALGHKIVFVHTQDFKNMRGDAAWAFRHFEKIPCRKVRFTSVARLRLLAKKHRPQVIVDALFGTGLCRQLLAGDIHLINWANRLRALRVAVDMPSGVDATTGQLWGTAFKADHTVTFQFSKLGMHLFPGSEMAGKIHVVAIGIPKKIQKQVGSSHAINAPHLFKPALADLPKQAHKGKAGRLLVIGGSKNFIGAPLMAGYAALKTGGGLVSVVLPAGCFKKIRQDFLELIYHPLPDKGLARFGLENLDEILSLIRTQDAVVLGPGLGRHPETLELVRRIVSDCDRPLLVDADALSAFAGSGFPQAGGRKIVITPHEGEMATLAGIDVQHIQTARLDVARAYAEREKVFVVLKGYQSLIAHPQGLVDINPTGNPGMASAGMGDVLCGVIGSLLRRFDMKMATRAGVYLHGLAGDLIAGRHGAHGLRAMELADHIPAAIESLKS